MADGQENWRLALFQCPYCTNTQRDLLERVDKGWLCHVCSRVFRVLTGEDEQFLRKHKIKPT